METTSLKQPSASRNSFGAGSLAPEQVEPVVEDVLMTTPFIDIHTHLFSPSFGKLGLWGIDELLTYHYLEAEFFRYSDLSPEAYWSLSKRQQADAIWRALFVENAPISESARGIVAILKAFDLPTDSQDLSEARAFFKAQSLEAHIRRVLQMTNVSMLVMTNDPLDPEEAPLWLDGVQPDPYFRAVLRLDRLLCEWSSHWQLLASQGYDVDERASGNSAVEVRRFLSDWHARMNPLTRLSFPKTPFAAGC